MKNLGSCQVLAIRDTCSAALKTQKLLVEYIDRTKHKQCCLNHLENVLIDEVMKVVNQYLKDIICDRLEE